MDADWRVTVAVAAIPGLMQVGHLMAERARRIVPVDSGRLKRSIYHKQVGEVQHVGAGDTEAPYADYVERGAFNERSNRRNPAQPFLREAAYLDYGEIR